MTTEALFDEADLKTPVGQEVSAEDATAAEKIVWGWIADATGMTERPDPIPPGIFSAAVELGAMVVDRQIGRTQRARGPFNEGFDTSRVETILETIRGSSQDGSTAGVPQGCFPPAQAWPDPIRVGCTSPW